MAERIKAAREFGDISENSEYDDAKNEQALLETRILRLKEQLRGARVIDTSDIPKDVVSIGSKVKVKYVDDGETDEYEIVGSAEADPANNRLSNESPVGQAVLGHKKGEVVEVAAPSRIDQAADREHQGRVAAPALPPDPPDVDCASR